MNKLRYSSRSTFSAHNCTGINTSLGLKRVYKGHCTCSRCPCVPDPPLARPTAAVRVPTDFQKSLRMCLHTHTEMYKHTQEKEAEKYVNLKHLANVSELTSLMFGFLVFLLLEGGQGRGGDFASLGWGRNRHKTRSQRVFFHPLLKFSITLLELMQTGRS